MTLPDQIILPLRRDYENAEDTDRYDVDLVRSLQESYEQVAENVNGFIRSDAEVDQAKWVPEVAGTAVAGVWPYVRQVGWSIRQGIFTELFFDIEWGVSTGVGVLYLQLPYRVLQSAGMPFVGAVQISGIATGPYTAYYINAIPNTYRGEFWTSGSGLATTTFAAGPAGRVIGSVKYIGVADE